MTFGEILVEGDVFALLSELLVKGDLDPFHVVTQLDCGTELEIQVFLNIR